MKWSKNDWKEFKIWIKALRSGQWPQTHYWLEDDKGFCCYGVACKLFIPQRDQVTVNFDWHEADGNYLRGGTPMDQPFAPQWLKNLMHDFAKKTGEDLMRLNDSYMLDFNEIADVLELVYKHKRLIKKFKSNGVWSY